MSADQVKILELQRSKKELKIKLVLAFCDTSRFVSKHCQYIVFTWRHGGHICVQNDESAAMFVYKKILWELNSFHMLKLSFIPSNLQSCWPRDWKPGAPNDGFFLSAS